VVLHAQVDGPWQIARVSMSINRLQRPRLVVVGNGMAGMRTVESSLRGLPTASTLP
jgi:hypothetical protein